MSEAFLLFGFNTVWEPTMIPTLFLLAIIALVVAYFSLKHLAQGDGE